MKIIKEEKFYGFTGKDADENIALVRLEDGEWILIRDDGTAVGFGGRIYACVSEEVESEPMPADDPLLLPFTMADLDKEPPKTFPLPDTDLVTLGWTTDSKTPVIMVRVDGELRVADKNT